MSNDKVLGIVSIVPKGEWNANQYYEKLNLVTYNKTVWLAKSASRGIAPGENPSYASYWMKLIDGSAIGKEGKSAYDIWLELGNTGTEADFIASLKGAKGETGISLIYGKMQQEIGEVGTFYPIIQGTKSFAETAITPELDVLYYDVLTNILYNWSGTSYVVQAEFQEKYDDTLETDDKTVAGAINEINNKKQGKIYEHTYRWLAETSAQLGAYFETRISFLSQKSSVVPTVESLRNYLLANGYTSYNMYKPCNGFIAEILDNVVGIYADGAKVYVIGTKNGSFLTNLELVLLIDRARNVKELI